MKLDRIPLDHAHTDHPNIWDRANPNDVMLKEIDGRDIVVTRRNSDNSHVVTLTLIYSDPYGKCSCDGFGYRGICSHLAAVYRAWSNTLVELPKMRPVAIYAETINPEQERADQVV